MVHIYNSAATKHHVLNKNTGLWETKEWHGSMQFQTLFFNTPNFYGQSVWNSANNVYISGNGIHDYVLNGDTWDKITWNNSFTVGRYTTLTYNGQTYLCSRGLYVLDEEELTWKPITLDVQGECVGMWSDGTRLYVVTVVFDYSIPDQPPTETYHHYLLPTNK
jgi:hypothetical protein